MKQLVLERLTSKTERKYYISYLTCEGGNGISEILKQEGKRVLIGDTGTGEWS